MLELEQYRYPVGRFRPEENNVAEQLNASIKTLEELPGMLRKAVQDLTDSQLDTPYREGGWTVRQVVHHLADSHMNSYIRMKLTLTEDLPVIKPYFEARWAELPEAKTGPIEVSLTLLEAIHKRMVMMLENVKGDEWERKFHHPESKKEWKLYNVVHLYAWHSRHHLAHITRLAERSGWTLS